MRNRAYGMTTAGDALLDTPLEINRVAATSSADVHAQHPKLTQILAALDAVNQRDQATISQLFALDDTAPITLEHRAGIHNLTSERVLDLTHAAIESAHRSPYVTALVAY